MRIRIEGPDSVAIADALQSALDAEGLTAERVVERDDTKDAATVLGVLTLIITLPQGLLALAQFKDRLAQQKIADALQARVARLEAERPGNTITAVKEEGELWRWK